MAGSGRRLSPGFQALLSAYWFSTNFMWTALLLVALPAQVAAVAGPEAKGRALALVLALGALVALIWPPVVGLWSDRVRWRWGRRHPFMVAGTAVATAGLLILGGAHTLAALLSGYLILEFGSNLATAPYSALIPEIVPPDQRGSASGYMGLMTAAGSIAGAVAAGAWVGKSTVTLYLFTVALLWTTALATVLWVREAPLPHPEAEAAGAGWRRLAKSFWISPRQYPDFWWVFWTRFFIVLGTWMVQETLQYFLDDVIRRFTLFGTVVARTGAEAVSIIGAVIMLAGVVTAVAGGAWSDRVGRKRMVYLSGGAMSIAVVAFLFTRRFEVLVLLGVFFGLGNGAYTSVDWALATDVLPSAADYAKDMGIWNMSAVLPQVLAVPIAGPIIDRFFALGQTSTGYLLVFSAAACLFVAGTFLVAQVRRAL